MIIKDLSFALRNLRRNKSLAVINIVGLSIGITACLMVGLIASYEMSFDRFQPDKDRIFRVYSSFSGASSGSNSGVPTAFANAIRETFTGISSVANFHTFGATVKVSDGDRPAKTFGPQHQIVIADPEYFKVFNYYEWLIGNPAESLSEPHRVVLTEGRARIYFGNIDLSSVIGREIYYRDSLVVTVSGIVKDVKQRTDFDFTDFISFSTIEKSWIGKTEILLDAWQNTSSSCQLFIKLSEGVSPEDIQSQLPALSATYKEHNRDAQWTLNAKMQPLTELHFNAELRIFNHSRSVMPKSTLQILLVTGGLLLIIAIFNFVNLETAQASRRAKQVGVLKVLGSSRERLIIRFLSESFILSLLAGTMSLGLADASFRLLTPYVPEGFEFNLFDPEVLIFFVSCISAVTLLSGLYPAFVLSSYKPALALKSLTSSKSGTKGSVFLRKALTIFQFSFAQVLIVGTIVIVGQLQFMLNKDLGFDSRAVVFISPPRDATEERLASFGNEVNRYPEIEAFTLHGNPPLTAGYASGIMRFDNGKEITTHNVHLKYGDTSYLRVYGIELLAGRNVLPVDSLHEFLINETFMKLLGFKEPRDVIGKTLDNAAPIVGVIKDFHGQPLQNEIKPTAIFYRPGRNFGIKLATSGNKVEDFETIMAKIEGAYKKAFPDETFEYFFVDERIRQFYQAEERMGNIAAFATVIALFISCIGLFGLASFMIIQRTKEIGIRKVLGASIKSIMFLLSRDFLKPVIIAFVISAPVIYFLIDRWLERFAYRMDVSVWIFLVSGITSVFIALITISLHTMAAANADPVNSLRYE